MRKRRAHLASDQKPDPGRCMRWLLADRRCSQGLIRAGIREHGSQPTSAFLSGRLPANASSRRELDRSHSLGRVVKVTGSITGNGDTVGIVRLGRSGASLPLALHMLQRRHQQARRLVATAASTAAGLGDGAVTVPETEGVRDGRYGLQTRAISSVFLAASLPEQNAIDPRRPDGTRHGWLVCFDFQGCELARRR